MSRYTKRSKAFQNAWKGIAISCTTEFHMRVHLVATLVVILMAIFFGVTKQEWIFLVLLIGLVFITELFNTALEKVCNYIQPEFDQQIGWIKDISAGAVLVAALTAAIGGGIIFVPYLLS